MLVRITLLPCTPLMSSAVESCPAEVASNPSEPDNASDYLLVLGSHIKTHGWTSCIHWLLHAGDHLECRQYLLCGSDWRQSHASTMIGDKKYFAPGNCRAAADNPAYKDLLDGYIMSKWSLRYSGGMVPDIHHILAQVTHARLRLCEYAFLCRAASNHRAAAWCLHPY